MLDYVNVRLKCRMHPDTDRRAIVKFLGRADVALCAGDAHRFGMTTEDVVTSRINGMIQFGRAVTVEVAVSSVEDVLVAITPIGEAKFLGSPWSDPFVITKFSRMFNSREAMRLVVESVRRDVLEGLAFVWTPRSRRIGFKAEVFA